MHLYGLILGIAIVIGLNYFEKRQTVIPKKNLLFFEIGLLISSLIGARTYHVIDQWQFYSHNLWLIPQTWNGGIGIFGGIIGAFVFIYFYSRVLKFKIIKLLNYVSPILPLCQFIGRFGNFVNHENPIWWPEAIGDLLIFLFIQKFPHNPTTKYLVGYGIIRFITEFWRSDTWVLNQIKVGQIISIIFIILGLILIHRDQRQISQKHH